ncbi:hypothetical protein BN1263320057 [Stenotrophomonas maltophilia]|nr:hypothetical protein BN1263320057 [Stenotrophomonas maltophilia]
MPRGGAQFDLQRPGQGVVDPGLPLFTDRLQAQLGHRKGGLRVRAGGGRRLRQHPPALAPVAGAGRGAGQQRQEQAGQGQAWHQRIQENGPSGLYPILNGATATPLAYLLRKYSSLYPHEGIDSVRKRWHRGLTIETGRGTGPLKPGQPADAKAFA